MAEPWRLHPRIFANMTITPALRPYSHKLSNSYILLYRKLVMSYTCDTTNHRLFVMLSHSWSQIYIASYVLFMHFKLTDRHRQAVPAGNISTTQQSVSNRRAARTVGAITDSFCARQHICCKRAYAIAILSVRLSVCLSVCHTGDSCKTVEVRIMQFSPYSSPNTLVFAR